MARHRAVSQRFRWRRRSSAQALIPAPRRRSIELVDGLTRLGHRASPEALAAGRQRGEYEALCGAWVLAASLTERAVADVRSALVSEPEVEIEAVYNDLLTEAQFGRQTPAGRWSSPDGPPPQGLLAASRSQPGHPHCRGVPRDER